MGREQREWAKAARLRLIDRLGGVCAHRKKSPCGGELQIDHIEPKLDHNGYRRMDPSWRMAVYHEQEKRGELQVLCKKHNEKKGPHYAKPEKRSH